MFQSKRIERLRDRLLSRGPQSVAGRPGAVRPEARAAYQRVRPLAEAMYLVMAADQAVTEAERDALRGAIRTLSDGDLGTKATEDLISEFERDLSRDGLDFRLDAIASAIYGDREDAELAVALAAAVAYADDHVDADEQRTIQELGERLGVTGRRLERLLAGEDDPQ